MKRIFSIAASALLAAAVFTAAQCFAEGSYAASAAESADFAETSDTSGAEQSPQDGTSGETSGDESGDEEEESGETSQTSSVTLFFSETENTSHQREGMHPVIWVFVALGAASLAAIAAVNLTGREKREK